MISDILTPLSFELLGLRIAGPAILVMPALVSIVCFPISCLLWIFREAKQRESKGWFIFPTFRRRREDSTGKSISAHSNDKTSLMRHQLDEILKQEKDLQKEREEIQREIEDLPRQYEEGQLKRKKIMRERAQTATAFHGFEKPKKLHSVASRTRRMTRPELRSARYQLLLLIAILTSIFVLLWKSLH